MTSRHPSFRRSIPADQLVTSTEAARILAGPDRPLAFERLYALRAAGLITPVDVSSRGPRYDRLEVEYHQNHAFTGTACPDPDEDPLGSARMLGRVMVAAVAVVVFGVAWMVLR